MPSPSLRLHHLAQSWPIETRPITIGRLPECDLVLETSEVSRWHAYVIPTPDGPLLIDRSRHGTRVNGELLHGPVLLAEGDEFSVGDAVLQIRRGPGRSSGSAPGSPAPSPIRRWLRRYGPSEVLGTLAAVGVAVAIQETTGSTLAAAYLGALAENVGFYGLIFLRESVREAHQAGLRGRAYSAAETGLVFRNMVLEFGVAEAIDTGVIRPACIGLGLRLLGGPLGALAGKLVADVVFYGPVLTMYEWRLARHRAQRREDGRRRTTATGIHVIDPDPP